MDMKINKKKTKQFNCGFINYWTPRVKKDIKMFSKKRRR